MEGLWFLLHYQCWIQMLSRTPPGCPVVAGCRGDPEALPLQEQPLHTLQQLLDGVDAGVCQLKSPGSGPGW